MKICGKCKIEKHDDEFCSSEYEKSCGRCRLCKCEDRKEYKSRPGNKEKIANGLKKWNEENKERAAELKSNWYYANKPRLSVKNKEYYQENKEEIHQNQKQYREEHKEETREYNKRYRQENKEYFNEYSNEYQKNRKKNDPEYKLHKNISNSVYQVLKHKKGGRSVLKYLPYTMEELRKHIEEQFKLSGNEWMTWDNHGKYNPKTHKTNPTWNLDHIIAQSLLPYDSMEHENFQKCWALSNLQPLDSLRNILKSNK